MIKLTKDLKTLLKISNERKNSGDMIGAISLLLTDKPHTKTEVEVYYHLGNLYLESKNYNLAIYHFLKYAQFANLKGRCKAYNAIGYVFLLENNKYLANIFFNEQLEISVRQECEYNEQMYNFFTEEEKKLKKFKPLKKSVNDISYHTASIYMAEEKYEIAIEEFKKVEGTLKGKSIYFIGMCYFFLKDTEKGLAYMREYFNHYKANVSEYLDLISLLSAHNMSEREYYIQEVLKETPANAKEYFYVAEMLFTYTEKYQTILEYIKNYNKEYPYSESAFCLKGLVYKYMGDNEKAFAQIKKAYLLTHGAKYKYLMNNLDSENYYKYPDGIKKEYQVKLANFFEKSYTLTQEDAHLLVDYAIEFSDQTFWMMLITLLGDCKKRFATFYLKELLIVPKAPISSKIFAIEQLSLKGEVGKLGIFDTDGFNVIELFSTAPFKNKNFVSAYCRAYSRTAIFAKSDFYDRAVELYAKLENRYDEIKYNDLVGVVLYYCYNNSFKAGVYKSLSTTKATVNKLIKEYGL